MVGKLVAENRARALSLNRGRASGGPRDGVMIEASALWDGLIAPHSGRYYWDVRSDGWVWTTDVAAPPRQYKKK